MDIGVILFVFLFVLLYLNPNNILFKNLNSTMVFSIMFLAFIILLILFPSQSFKSAQYGFNLWLTVVFPSLFPFFVASELLNGTGLIKYVGVLLEPIMRPLFNVPGIGSFAFIMGISSGYPVGAKITTDFRKSNLCTKAEAERLLAFTNNSSPLFITGAIATGILGHPEIGLILLGGHIAASITVGILFRFHNRGKLDKGAEVSSNSKHHNRPKISTSCSTISFKNIGQKLGDSIKNSINTLLMICGFIVIFCVIINLLISLKFVYFIAFCFQFIFHWLNIDFNMASAIISGLFEMTTGTSYISHSVAPITQKIIVASFLLGWGGLSVHAQVASIIADSDISLKPYLAGKFLQGIISAVFTFIFLNLTGILKRQDVAVFGNFDFSYRFDWLTYTKNSLALSGFVIAIIIGLALAAQILNHLSSFMRKRLAKIHSH